MPEPIEVQLARLDEQVKALRQVVEGARYVAESANRNAETLAVHEERFKDLHEDVVAIEARMEVAVKRVEKSCNELGDLIRDTADRQRQADQERALLKERAQTADREQDSRRNLLYGVAGAFAATAFGVLAHLAGLV